MRVEIVHPGDGWVLDELARILIDRVPGAFGSVGRSTAREGTDLTYYIHHGIFGQSHATLRGCFFPHKEPNKPSFDLAAQCAHLCIAPCRSSLEHCLAQNPNSHLVYHGIDLQRFRPRLRIGFVGREYPGGRKGSNVFAFLRSLDFVDFHATNGALPADQIPGFIASMDYVLIASKVEGGPLCFQEALASGREVISTDVGMVSDFRDAPGVHLYRYDDTGSLMQVLQAALDRRLALRRSIERFSEQYFADEHARLFAAQFAASPEPA